MGIYDKKSVPVNNYVFDSNGKPSFLVLALVVGLLIVILVGLAISFFSVKPIIYSFDKNPISATEQSILKVGIGNPFEETARDVTVEVFPEDKTSIAVAQPIRTIEVLDKFRELTFLVNPVGNTLPGNYVINISVTINGQKYAESALLTIA